MRPVDVPCDTGKQRIAVCSNEIDSKLASTGLTEKQLQLSVEVWKKENSQQNTQLNNCILALHKTI